MAKKKAAKKKAPAKAAREQLVVGSKVKAYIKSNGNKTSSDVIEALNCKVHCLLDKACARAAANKRTTLRGADL
ncbi:MAG: hypothetical protein QF473_02875 [Planctomycetota bacterium]|jgi:hypothetical protein|nr:hypothetical protein [Planctomycetota bacterium]